MLQLQKLPLRDPPGTLAACLLLAAVLAFDLVALLVNDEFPGVGARITIGMVLGLISLAAAWLAGGKEYLLVRLGVALVVVTLLSGPVGKVTRPNWSEWLGVLLVFTTVVALLLRGGDWLLGGERGDGNASPRKESGRRYTVGTLLVLLTAACLLLGVGKQARFPWQHAAAVLAYLAGFSVISVAAAAVTRVRRVALAAALPVLVVLCPLVGLVLGHIESPGNMVEPFTMIVVVQSLTIWLGLGIRLLFEIPPAEHPEP